MFASIVLDIGLQLLVLIHKLDVRVLFSERVGIFHELCLFDYDFEERLFVKFTTWLWQNIFLPLKLCLEYNIACLIALLIKYVGIVIHGTIKFAKLLPQNWLD